MKLIERSDERLVFRTGVPFLQVSRCELDRRTGRAIIKRMAVLWPRKTVDVALTDIVAVESSSVSSRIEDTDVRTTIPQIVLSSGKRINLSVINADTKTAPKVVEALTGFLKL